MLFSQDIGIDLGTSNTLVFVKGKGIIIREPSVVAVDQRFTPVKVVAVGSEAKDMIGRTPGSIVALRPLRDGVIADFDATAEMLKKFIRKAITASPLSKTRVMICVPSGVTEVERRAVNDAAKSAGARYVSLIEEPMAAAIGAGIDVEKPEGSMIVDIGGGTAEIAVISLGGIFYSNTASYIDITSMDALSRLSIDTVFIGATGITLENGLTNTTYLEAEMKRIVIRRSRGAVLMADHGKFDSSSIITFCKFEDLSCVVTDTLPPQRYIDAMRINQIRLLCPETEKD